MPQVAPLVGFVEATQFHCPYVGLVPEALPLVLPRPDGFLAGAALIACGFLLSLTASSEYWDNFANVARLFLPACAGLLLAARQWKGRIVSGTFLFFSLLLLFREAKSVYDIEVW
jgi:zinc transporter ZupT